MKKRLLSVWEDIACFVQSASDDLRGLSLALFFVGDGSNCPVFASRCPTQDLAPGVDLCRALGFDRETSRYLGGIDYRARVIRTSLGIGVLSKRFTPLTGMGLYIHFHAPADAAAAIFNNYLLPGDYELSDNIEEMGCGMTAAYERVLERIRPVWDRLLTLAHSFPQADRDGLVEVDMLRDWIKRAAAAVGCRLRSIDADSGQGRQSCSHDQLYDVSLDYVSTKTERLHRSAMLDEMYESARLREASDAGDSGQPAVPIPDDRSLITHVRWPGGSMWEAYLLYCLLQARMYDPERGLSCVLSAYNGEEREFPDISFSFSIAIQAEEKVFDQLPRLPYPLRAGFGCLEQATAYNGAIFFLSVGRPERAAFDQHLHTWVFPLTAHFGFLNDIALELEGDIKTEIELIDDWEESDRI